MIPALIFFVFIVSHFPWNFAIAVSNTLHVMVFKVLASEGNIRYIQGEKSFFRLVEGLKPKDYDEMTNVIWTVNRRCIWIL